MKKSIEACGLVVLIFLVTLRVFAQQTDNGGLRGKVVDPNGAIVPGATVTVKNPARGVTRTVQTNESGEWSVAVLPLGDYQVQAMMAGFQPVMQKITVAASVTGEILLVLGISQSAEVIVMERDDITLVLTQQGSTTGTQITGKRVEELPVANRSTLGTLALDSSVAADISNPLDNGNGNPEASVNGTRTTSQTQLFNGIDATNFS